MSPHVLPLVSWLVRLFVIISKQGGMFHFHATFGEPVRNHVSCIWYYLEIIFIDYVFKDHSPA